MQPFINCYFYLTGLSLMLVAGVKIVVTELSITWPIQEQVTATKSTCGILMKMLFRARLQLVVCRWEWLMVVGGMSGKLSMELIFIHKVLSDTVSTLVNKWKLVHKDVTVATCNWHSQFSVILPLQELYAAYIYWYACRLLCICNLIPDLNGL